MQDRRDFLMKYQGNRCAITGKPFRNTDKVDFHHAKVHNTEANREKYPYFIDSVINGVLAEHGAHLANGHVGKEQNEAIIQAYENFLRSWAELLQSGADVDNRLIEFEMNYILDNLSK